MNTILFGMGVTTILTVLSEKLQNKSVKFSANCVFISTVAIAITEAVKEVIDLVK